MIGLYTVIDVHAIAQNSPSKNHYQDEHLRFLCFWLALVALWVPTQHS